LRRFLEDDLVLLEQEVLEWYSCSGLSSGGKDLRDRRCVVSLMDETIGHIVIRHVSLSGVLASVPDTYVSEERIFRWSFCVVVNCTR